MEINVTNGNGVEDTKVITDQKPQLKVTAATSPKLQSESLTKELQEAMDKDGIWARCKAYQEMKQINCAADLTNEQLKHWSQTALEACKKEQNCIQKLYGWKIRITNRNRVEDTKIIK